MSPIKDPKTSNHVIKVPVKQRGTMFADPLKYKVLKEESINLTKDKAFSFLELDTFSGERNISENHVQFLYDEWCGGRFLWHHVLLASAELNGKRYRVNGQHTCWMRVNVPKDREPIKADVREITYKVETEEQLRTLYSAFDRNKTRSMAHISRVLLEDTPATKDLPVHLIGKLVSGFKVHWTEDFGHHHGGLSVNELTSLISKQYSSLFNVVGHFVRIHYEDHTFVKRSSTIGAMFGTFEKSVQASADFWTPVCDGIGINEKSDPRYQLRQFLMTHGHNLTGAGSRNIVSIEYAFRMCINAWNRFRRKEKTLVLRTTDTRVKAI